MTAANHNTRLHEQLQEILKLLNKQKVVEALVHRQDMQKHNLVESLVHKQNIVELKLKLDMLHPADLAYVLETLPFDDRLILWAMVKPKRRGEILLEVSDAVRESLIAEMDHKEIIAATEDLGTDELADLAPDLPSATFSELVDSMDGEDKAQLQSVMSYPEGSVGSLMNFEYVSIRDDVKLEAVLRYLRRLGDLPSHTDKLFVVDRKGLFKGILPVNRLLTGDTESLVRDNMGTDAVSFRPEDLADEAAKAFERYDLITVPVVDSRNRLLGRLSVDEVIHHISGEFDSDMLSMAGLRQEEDLFASVWRSLQNRWAWLVINLVTAFIASRVVGAFEGTIEKLVALAALMPIVAGIGGNSGNQTVALIIRALALGQINGGNLRKLIVKEIYLSLAHGVLWGSITGFLAFLLYRSVPLGMVMTGAMMLNILVAALAGVFIPLLMHKLGRDPAMGSSVLLTAITDSMGFFIFLGLASVFLV